jgi:hypothetical protein
MTRNFFVANTFQIHHSIMDWQFRQMWLFNLYQEHSTNINYQRCLHWHPININMYNLMARILSRYIG